MLKIASAESNLDSEDGLFGVIEVIATFLLLIRVYEFQLSYIHLGSVQ